MSASALPRRRTLRRPLSALASLVAALLLAGCLGEPAGDPTPPACGSGGNPFCTNIPVSVSGTRTWASLAAGQRHSCAVTTSGEAWCWGEGTSGQLGQGAGSSSAVPVRVAGARSWRTVDAGLDFTCALDTGGLAWCWGVNALGQLGNDDRVASATPVAVAGGHVFTKLAVGTRTSCALEQDGRAWCWGFNAFGTVGDSTLNDALVPVPVGTNLRFTAIATGGDATCGITTTAQLWCWGTNAFPIGAAQSPLICDRASFTPVGCAIVPVRVHPSLAPVSITAGNAHMCVLDAQGSASCWGGGVNGQLGDGSSGQRHASAPVRGAARYAALDAGGFHTCGVVTGNGGVTCWGFNLAGQTGAERQVFAQTEPITVGGAVATATAVSLGERHSCALLADGGIRCWGDFSRGQLGDGRSTF